MATLSARYANRSASIGRLLFVCSIMLACRTSEAANLDTTHTVVFSGRPGSHFGYTVELMNNRDGNLALVAAVKDQANSFLGANHTGALYKCRLDPHSCTEVQIQEEGNIREENNDQFSYHALNDYMHLGFSLAVQPGPNGRAIVCAPKWKNQRYYESMYMLNGACYVLSNDLTKLEVLRPFIRKSLQVVQPRINYYSLAEAGFSAHISQVRHR